MTMLLSRMHPSEGVQVSLMRIHRYGKLLAVNKTWYDISTLRSGRWRMSLLPALLRGSVTDCGMSPAEALCERECYKAHSEEPPNCSSLL